MFRRTGSNAGRKISRIDFLKTIGKAAAAMALATIPFMNYASAQPKNQDTSSNYATKLLPSYSAIVFQQSGEIIAKSYLGNTIESGILGTDDSRVIQSAIDALSSIGGGVLDIQTGTYTVTSIIPKSNIHIRFSNSANFKSVGNATAFVFRRTDQPGGLTNFILEGGTFTAGNAWYSEGSVSYCKFINNRFYGASGINQFLVFFDAFAPNPYNTITGNLFSGPTGGRDMLGSGRLDHSEISFNRFENGDGQGWGAADAHFSRCIANAFYQIGNIIGMEGTCEGNIISGNSAFLSKNLKLSGVGGNIEHISRSNIVVGNCMAYSGGIQDAQGYQDIIDTNTIIGSVSGGIFGSFDHCSLSNNMLFETNSGQGTIMVGGLSHNDGGIALLNNVTSIPRPTGTKIQGNTLYTSRTNWIFPTGGTKQGYTGGILIDTTYDSCIVQNNIIDNIYGDAIAYYGDNGTIRDNVGFPTDIFKESSATIIVGKSDAYAVPTSVSSASGKITSFNEKITIRGTLVRNEMITVKTEITYAGPNTNALERSFESTGSYYLTNDDLLSLWKNQAAITKINLYAKSNLGVTAASVMVDIFGSG